MSINKVKKTAWQEQTNSEALNKTVILKAWERKIKKPQTRDLHNPLKNQNI